MGEQPRRLVLDGDMLATPPDFHEHLKRELEFPDYYGNNLDAFWDMLTGWVETPLVVEWRNFGVSHRVLGKFSEDLLKTLRDAEYEVPGITLEIVE